MPGVAGAAQLPWSKPSAMAMMQRSRLIRDLFLSIKKSRSRRKSHEHHIRGVVDARPPFLWHVFLFVLLVALNGAGSLVAAELEGVVVAVPEGDALEVLHDGTVFFIRLQDVDAPEIGQPYAKEESLAHGKRAKVSTVGALRAGTSQKGTMTLASGFNLSHELLKAGLAWWDREAAAGDDSLWKLEREARTEHRGLWEDEDPIPPWEWRNGF
jgi:endonuclease YncB( thermonuclease family)